MQINIKIMGKSGSRSTEFKLQVKSAGSKEEELKKSVRYKQK